MKQEAINFKHYDACKELLQSFGILIDRECYNTNANNNTGIEFLIHLDGRLFNPNELQSLPSEWVYLIEEAYDENKGLAILYVSYTSALTSLKIEYDQVSNLLRSKSKLFNSEETESNYDDIVYQLTKIQSSISFLLNEFTTYREFYITNALFELKEWLQTISSKPKLYGTINMDINL